MWIDINKEKLAKEVEEAVLNVLYGGFCEGSFLAGKIGKAYITVSVGTADECDFKEEDNTEAIKKGAGNKPQTSPNCPRCGGRLNAEVMQGDIEFVSYAPPKVEAECNCTRCGEEYIIEIG